MMKKILLTIICVIFLSNIPALAADNTEKKELKPLKLEQNYEYGKLDKTFKNPNTEKENKFEEALNNTDKHEPSIFRIFNSLIFVILLILLTGWIYMKFKKINPEQLLSGKFTKLSENNFKIISSLQLGAGKAVYLIEINNKQLVVGTTATNVNLLAQMDKKDDCADKIPNECIEKLFKENDSD